MENDKNWDNQSFASSYTNFMNIDPSSDASDRNSFHYVGSSMSTIGNYLYPRKLRIKHTQGPLFENNLKGIADYILAGKAKNIIILTGAGISTSSGIPDFRTPNTGLYSMMERFTTSNFEHLFYIDYFRSNPEPFYRLCKHYMQAIENAKPTLTHHFIKLLADRNLLLRNYTQNVDGLELAAGIDPKLIVASHGTLSTASCIVCHQVFDIQQFKRAVLDDHILNCPCGGLVKPDVVFFGEKLPDYFFESVESDCLKCDLVIVAGTSLYVYPISHLTQLVSLEIPRLLINREKVGCFKGEDDAASSIISEVSSVADRRDADSMRTSEDFNCDKISSSGADIGEDSTETMELVVYDRDVIWLGNTDDGFKELIKLLGWEKDIDKLVQNFL